jgi:hypothetical protein
MNADKIREALGMLREGKAVNPTLLADMLEWALARDGERAAAQREFATARDAGLNMMKRLEELEKGEVLQIEEEPDLYEVRLEAALLALDKEGLVKTLKGTK